jgi:hypothetical protein
MRAGHATTSPNKAGQKLNSRSGQPPVDHGPGEVPSGKPAKPGEEPKLHPEAEDAREGGIMARIPPAPEGVLAEKPDPRASYQVGPEGDNSPLISVTATKGAPVPSASGIDTEDVKSEKPTPGEDKKPEAGKKETK